jgi:hypothetical protein
LTTLLSVVVANMTTMVEPVGALEARVELMPNKKVLVMVCVSKRDDCGRHCCALLPATEKEEKCFVQPVWCYRCLKRSGGGPTRELVKPEEVSSRFSTTLESVQIEFGLELTYPAVYSASEVEAEVASGLWEGVSPSDVVGTVEVGTPISVVRQRGMVSSSVSVVAFGDDRRYHSYGAAPPEFLGPGTVRDYLKWVERAQELDKWKEQQGE